MTINEMDALIDQLGKAPANQVFDAILFLKQRRQHSLTAWQQAQEAFNERALADARAAAANANGSGQEPDHPETLN